VTEIADGVSALRSCQRALRPTLGTALGVGRARAGPRGISESLQEAISGARLAERRAETGHFVDVSKFGATDLLLAWARTETFMPVAIELLEPLERLSEDLLRTLSVYLDAESSLAEAAAVLGVHRNTVAGHITRIQTLLGSDLSDPDMRLAIQLACRAMPRFTSKS
jgi:DNA-binding PucR family transcriptional regulator